MIVKAIFPMRVRRYTAAPLPDGLSSSQDRSLMDAPKFPTFRPLYQQIKDLLLERIASGEWSPGTYIPSEPRWRRATT